MLEMLKMSIMPAVALLAEVNPWPFARFCAEQVSLRGVRMREEKIAGNGAGTAQHWVLTCAEVNGCSDVFILTSETLTLIREMRDSE